MGMWTANCPNGEGIIVSSLYRAWGPFTNNVLVMSVHDAPKKTAALLDRAAVVQDA